MGLGDTNIYNGMHQIGIPANMDFKAKKKDIAMDTLKKEKAEKRISVITETSAAVLIASATASRKQIDPGLDRQPKTFEAVGISGMMRQKQQEGGSKDMDLAELQSFQKKASKAKMKGRKGKSSASDKFFTKQAVTASITQSKSRSIDSNDKKRMSKMSNAVSGRASQAIERPSQVEKTSVATKQSTLISDSESVTDDDVWDMDNDMSKHETDNEDQTFEMATVEIDVHEAQAVMDDVLGTALAEGRITSRKKAILSEKFELFLQALVSFQEREVEVIEFLNMKADILKMLNNFVAAEEDISQHLVVTEEEVVEEATQIGILDTKPKEETDKSEVKEGEGKTHTDSQGLSVAEMSATTIRETLLAQKNKIEMQEHMKTIHILELRQLEFEKALLAIHYSRMTKPADVQREMKELRRTVHDLQMEVSQNSQEIQQYEVDISVEEKGYQEDETLVEKLDLEVLTKQMQVQTNSNKPNLLAKEADRDAHKLEQLNDDYDTLCNKYLEGMETLRGYQSKLDSMTSELHTLVKEEGKMAQRKKTSLHETESLVSQMEALVSREQQLLDRASQMTDKINTVMKTRKKLQEDVYAVSNETNKALREATKIERTLRMTSDAHINAKLAYDKMRLAFDSARPKDDANNWEKLKAMLQREISNLKIALNFKLDDATLQADMVDKLQRRLNELYDEQLVSGKELQSLIRTTVRKRREREEKSEQCIKLEAQVFRLIQDGKMQKLVLDDCARTERDINHSMDFIKMQYNRIKISRAALMNDLISAKQKVSEQAEKFKICHNEVESYTNQCMERQKEIHRAHYINLNSALARDSVRNHALRCRDKFRFYRNEKNELLLTNRTFRKEVNKLNTEVNEARKRFEAATHESNKKAMAVRERTEEICTITEKIKAYEIIILNGNRQLTIREMEHCKLKSLFNEIQKNSVIKIAKRPDDGNIIKTIDKLREEFYETTAQRRKMEQELSDLTNPNRIRNVHHELIERRETLPMLQAKLDTLEEALAIRDVMSMEKELILKQVTQATEDSMEKANILKEHYKKHTNSLCTLRKQLYHMSSKIDGMISETSLAITQADIAEKQYHKMAQELEKAEKRFCSGLCPLQEMLDEWNHIKWREEMLKRSSRNLKSNHKFLVQPKTLRGSRIIMERFRPVRSRKKEFESTIFSSAMCRFPQV